MRLNTVVVLFFFNMQHLEKVCPYEVACFHTNGRETAVIF